MKSTPSPNDNLITPDEEEELDKIEERLREEDDKPPMPKSGRSVFTLRDIIEKDQDESRC